MSKRPIIHLEIPARDPHGTADFYSRLFGWDHQHFDEMEYTNVDTGHISLGILHASDERPGVVSFYVQSQDVAGDLRRIEAMGGQIVVPATKIEGVGIMGWFKDPEGNIIALGDFGDR